MSDYGTPPPPPPGGGYTSAPAPAGSGMMGTPQGGQFASWPVRVGGYLIDSLITLPATSSTGSAPRRPGRPAPPWATTNAASGADSGNLR